jgi:hypothetical protein
LLSSLPFGSFLSYSPRGTARDELASIAVCQQIKRDGHLGGPGASSDDRPIIPYAIRRVRQSLTPELAELLAPDAVLVPMPGRAPLPPRQPNALWVPRRICEELLAVGLGGSLEALLARRVPVPKSALARRGKRPSIQEHLESLMVAPRGRDLAASITRITLVDDVITKGATLFAGARRLAEAFPGATVRAFALVRTQYEKGHPRGRQTFRALVDPVVSTITLSRHGAWRRDP